MEPFFILQMMLGAFLGALAWSAMVKKALPSGLHSQPAASKPQQARQRKIKRVEQPLTRNLSKADSDARLMTLSDIEIINLARKKRKVLAIKAWQLKYNLGLKEAKEAVEARLSKR